MATKDNDSLISDKEKLEKLISSEGLDQLLLVVGPKGWAALLCCLAILIITLIWSIVGSIPITATGSGITMTEKGPYLIESQSSGAVANILVASGQVVEEGTVIAKLDNPVVALNIQTKKNEIAAKEAQIQALEAQRQTGIEPEIAAQQASLQNLKSELDLLQIESGYLEIRAEKGGKVLQLLIAPGDRVTPGTRIALMEASLAEGEKLQFFAAFPAQYGESLETGMPAQVELLGVDPKRYGFLLGKIKSVSNYPLSTSELQSIVKLSEIAAYLKGKEPLVYSVVIELDSDPNSESGYHWTTIWGPPWKIKSGEIGVARAVVERNPPIVYALPIKAATHVRGSK